MRKADKILNVLYSALFAAATAWLSASFVDTSTEWYQSLKKPELLPPAVVFFVVWTAIYILFAVSLSLVSINPLTPSKTFLLYAVCGVSNVLWTYAFFICRNDGGSVFLLIALIAAAAMLYADAYSINKASAYLLIPYALWLCFALYLNYETAFLN